VNVQWTATAIEHLRSIHSYIAQSSPRYVQRIVDRLTRRSQEISEFPLSGRIVPEAEAKHIREVMEGPYRLIYYIKSDQIDILAAIHGAQQTPWSL